jgi:c-di-AMP phosphodiesterase-like protein
MDNSYIKSMPIPACTVDTDGRITSANKQIKNVFPYEDILGYSFFTLTGIKREQLLKANTEERILNRNERSFKLWINDDAREDEELVVLFDEATARESFRKKLENERAAIVYINIDNFDDLIASAPEDYKRVIPSQIDGIVRKWGDSFQSPVISTGDETYVMYTSQGKLNEMVQSNFSVLDEVRHRIADRFSCIDKHRCGTICRITHGVFGSGRGSARAGARPRRRSGCSKDRRWYQVLRRYSSDTGEEQPWKAESNRSCIKGSHQGC